MTIDDEAFRDQIISHAAAASKMDEIAGYLRRGREHEHLPLANLQAAYEAALHAWAVGQHYAPSEHYLDLSAEFELHRLEPDYAGLKSDMDLLSSKIQTLKGREDAADIVGGKIIDTYLRDQKHRN